MGWALRSGGLPTGAISIRFWDLPKGHLTTEYNRDEPEFSAAIEERRYNHIAKNMFWAKRNVIS